MRKNYLEEAEATIYRANTEQLIVHVLPAKVEIHHNSKALVRMNTSVLGQ